MAGRLCFEGRVRIEVLVLAGRSASETERRLGRHPTTVQREFKRCGPGAYCARSAQTAAVARAERLRVPKLASDAVLAAEVQERSKPRRSPHAV